MAQSNLPRDLEVSYGDPDRKDMSATEEKERTWGIYALTYAHLEGCAKVARFHSIFTPWEGQAATGLCARGKFLLSISEVGVHSTVSE